MKDDPLIKIGVAGSEPIALMWQEILAQHGIRSMVKAAAGGAHALSPVPGPHYFYVLASEEKRARALLELNDDEGADSG